MKKRNYQERAEFIMRHSTYGYLPKVQSIGRALRPRPDITVSIIDLAVGFDLVNIEYVEIVKLSMGIPEPIKFLPKPK